MVEALLALASSDQGLASREFADLSTLAEDALDLAAAGIERIGLRVDTEAFAGRDEGRGGETRRCSSCTQAWSARACRTTLASAQKVRGQ